LGHYKPRIDIDIDIHRSSAIGSCLRTADAEEICMGVGSVGVFSLVSLESRLSNHRPIDSPCYIFLFRCNTNAVVNEWVPNVMCLSTKNERQLFKERTFKLQNIK